MVTNFISEGCRLCTVALGSPDMTTTLVFQCLFILEMWTHISLYCQ